MAKLLRQVAGEALRDRSLVEQAALIRHMYQEFAKRVAEEFPAGAEVEATFCVDGVWKTVTGTVAAVQYKPHFRAEGGLILILPREAFDACPTRQIILGDDCSAWFRWDEVSVVESGKRTAESGEA